jgi:murein DD-endopeptidase MepM/ murein hydrolase activator NlpD
MIQLTYPINPPITITQHFGENPQDYARFGFPGHEGIDFAGKFGDNVLSAAEGEVYQVVYSKTHPYGNHIRIQHDGFKTIYAHLSEILIPLHFSIPTGMLIGRVGSTGNSTAPHLHLTLKIAGHKTPGYPPEIADPEPFFTPTPPSPSPFQGEGRGEGQAGGEGHAEGHYPPIARAVVKADVLNVRTLPFDKSHIARQLHKGDQVDILEFAGDTLWAYIGNGEYIALKYNANILAELQSIS